MRSKPRVAFLVPIASRRTTEDWHLACAYFKQTLSSIFNSTSGNFCVVVAGHEPPDFQLPQDPRFKFLSLNHPLPSRENGYRRRLFDHVWYGAVKDKMIKLAAAWDYAKSTWNPQYVMKFDWDDLVSCRLVDWLVSVEDGAGYLIKHGWVWRSGSRYLIQRTEKFDRVCGSCLIIRSDLADKTGPFLHSPDGTRFDDASLQMEATDGYSLIPGAATGTLLLNDSHMRAEPQFAYLGHRLGTVPFSAAIWRIGHANNITSQLHLTQTVRMFLGRIRRTRLITSNLKKEFMLG
jgi:hypothetical protein